MDLIQIMKEKMLMKEITFIKKNNKNWELKNIPIKQHGRI